MGEVEPGGGDREGSVGPVRLHALPFVQVTSELRHFLGIVTA